MVLWEIFSLGGMPYTSIPHEDLYNKLLQEEYRLPQPDLATASLYVCVRVCGCLGCMCVYVCVCVFRMYVCVCLGCMCVCV